MNARMEPRGMRLTDLLSGVARVSAAQDREVRGLCMDSRQARPGDLFCACAGGQQHGGRFLGQALDQGIEAVLWEPSEQYPDLPPPDESAAGVPVIPVAALSSRIGAIADRFFGHPSRDLLVIGVTGTDGKTSCSQFLANALSAHGEPTAVLGTLGYGLYGALQPASHTTPDPVRLHGLLAEMRARGARRVVMEVSSHALDQGRTDAVAFDTAVLTNLTRDHLDYHGDAQAYAEAKGRLFAAPGLKHAVLNLDDAFGRRLLKQMPVDVSVTGYGLQLTPEFAALPRVEGTKLELQPDGMQLSVRAAGECRTVHSPLLGEFNASNLLAVLAVLLVVGVPFQQACALLEHLDPVPGRMERFGGGDRPVVVIDYAHTPEALRHALRALREHCRGRVVAVFGCGGDRDPGKRRLMGAAAEELADDIVLTDDNPRSEDPEVIVADIRGGMRVPGRARVEHDRRRAIALALADTGPGDVVLVAGKGHEAYQVIGSERRAFSDRAVAQQLLEEGGL